MKLIPVVVSVGYSVGQITLGLLLHPYQTMQQLLEDKIFVWMALLPTGALGVVMLVWRFVVVPVVQMVFSCSSGGGVAGLAGGAMEAGFGDSLIASGLLTLCGWLPFVADWLSLFCIYWQVLLLYLLVRFHLVFQKS